VIAIVDYGMGNRRSVEKAFEHVGADAVITGDHALLRAAEKIVVPGVGAFPAAMERLDALGLTDLLRERARAGTPLLGICLGMQLLFEHSSEHDGARGLGLLEGEVTYLDTHGARLPHIGWNLVRMQRPGRLTEGLGDRAFYHVHSLACRPEDPGVVVGTAEYGEPFASIVERDNVFGAQFHPEKSSRDGLALLANFTQLAPPPGAGVRA
jgi:imidazole glycerol-phosphate synthase subunit HisH